MYDKLLRGVEMVHVQWPGGENVKTSDGILDIRL